MPFGGPLHLSTCQTKPMWLQESPFGMTEGTSSRRLIRKVCHNLENNLNPNTRHPCAGRGPVTLFLIQCSSTRLSRCNETSK